MRHLETTRPRHFALIVRAVPLLCACAGWIAFCPRAAAQPLEYEVKAAFLLNFTKFIDWPPSAFADSNSPLAICVLGKDPFGSSLDQMLQGETVDNRQLIVRRLSEIPSPHQCQVVFFGSGDRDTPKTLSDLGRGVLTVGDGKKFLQDGGMIAFVIESRRVRFDIDQAAAERAGLTLSSKLLGVARVVQK